jgi:hypothetical protein
LENIHSIADEEDRVDLHKLITEELKVFLHATHVGIGVNSSVDVQGLPIYKSVVERHYQGKEKPGITTYPKSNASKGQDVEVELQDDSAFSGPIVRMKPAEVGCSFLPVPVDDNICFRRVRRGRIII